jgi:ABC-type antimicrobial peptide transport system permease subunit
MNECHLPFITCAGGPDFILIRGFLARVDFICDKNGKERMASKKGWGQFEIGQIVIFILEFKLTVCYCMEPDFKPDIYKILNFTMEFCKITQSLALLLLGELFFMNALLQTIWANTMCAVSVFLKIHGARCGVEKGTQMGGLLGGEG